MIMYLNILYGIRYKKRCRATNQLNFLYSESIRLFLKNLYWKWEYRLFIWCGLPQWFASHLSCSVTRLVIFKKRKPDRCVCAIIKIWTSMTNKRRTNLEIRSYFCVDNKIIIDRNPLYTVRCPWMENSKR